MKNLLLAIQFLTIIPVKITHFNEKKIAESAIYFPLVGLLLGLMLAGSNNILLFLGFGKYATSIILVVLLIALTRGLHLDGLADTSDAFLSIKNKEQMLEIMRDCRIGVMGALSIISIILLKIALIASVKSIYAVSLLLLMCLLSRWSMVMLMFFFPYARQEGKAKSIIAGINTKIFASSTLIALSCALFIAGYKGILTMLVVACFTLCFGILIKNKIGGITGDTIGATNELNEVVVLFTFSIIGGLI